MAAGLDLDDKWNSPGWKIEQKYSPGVLIGNWAEDKLEVSTRKGLCSFKIVLNFMSSLRRALTKAAVLTEKHLRTSVAFINVTSLAEARTCS